MRHSHRYPGYLRIYNTEYRKTLMRVLQNDAADLIEMLNLQETMEDLQQRLDNPDKHSVVGKLTREILDELDAESPMNVQADEFNQAAERYYRNRLKKFHLLEAFRILEGDLAELYSTRMGIDNGVYKEAIHRILKDKNPLEYLDAIKNDVIAEIVPEDDLRKLIYLILIILDYHAKQTSLLMEETRRDVLDKTPVHPAG